tara:strand:- start:1254 stop:1994 length:741 start_codon:yes stop_codon:yes gene_type:complete
MKLLILAAGQGKRLMPLTENKPKCMVEYNGKAIIDCIIDTAKNYGIKDIAIISGYKGEVLERYLKEKNLIFYRNQKYSSTNMVSTLFCAKEFMDEDLIISYSDIVYKQDVLKKIIESKDDFSLIIDRKWKELWLKRMDNPLHDAETLKIKNGKIVEIGKKPRNYNDIQGQYVGLIKISKNIIEEVKQFYESLDKNIKYDGQNFENMYMTSFIQKIIDNLISVKPVFIDGGWVEIDSVNDLNVEMVA